MRVDDIPKVFHLGEEIYSATGAPALYRTWDPYEVAQLFASETELSLVAALGTKLVGFCLSTTVEKPAKPWRYGYIIWLGVDPAYRLRHIGRRLVQRTVRQMKGREVHYMLIDTPEDNRGAVNFFGRLGYRQMARQVWLWKSFEKSLSTPVIGEQGVAAVRGARSRARRGG